jgi:hypothetical protein
VTKQHSNGTTFNNSRLNSGFLERRILFSPCFHLEVSFATLALKNPGYISSAKQMLFWDANLLAVADEKHGREVSTFCPIYTATL